MENDSLFDLMSKMYSEIQKTNNEIQKTNQRLDNIEIEVKEIRNTVTKTDIKFEEINSKTNAINEGQTAFIEQLGRISSEDGKTFSDRFTLVERAITTTSSNLKVIKNELADVETVTKQNSYDITCLKLVNPN